MVPLSICCGQEFNHTKLQIAHAPRTACQDCQPSTQLPVSSQMLKCHGNSGHLLNLALGVQLLEGGRSYLPFYSGVARDQLGAEASWVLETEKVGLS